MAGVVSPILVMNAFGDTSISTMSPKPAAGSSVQAVPVHVNGLLVDLCKLPESYITFIGVPEGRDTPSRVRLIDEVKNISESFYPLESTPKLMCGTNRQCLWKIMNRHGGVQLFVLAGNIPRAPIFLFANQGEAILFAEHLAGLLKVFIAGVRRVDSRLSLEALTPYASGSNVLVDFKFFEEDTIGRDVVIAATERACYIFLQTNWAKELGVQDLVVTREVRPCRGIHPQEGHDHVYGLDFRRVVDYSADHQVDGDMKRSHLAVLLLSHLPTVTLRRRNSWSN